MLRILVAAPFLLVMVLFALSNPQHVNLGLWPTDLTLEAPLSLVVLVGMGFGFFFGALMIWFGAIAARMRARRAESDLRRTESQLNNLRNRPPPPPMPAPAVQAPMSGRLQVAGQPRAAALPPPG